MSEKSVNLTRREALQKTGVMAAVAAAAATAGTLSTGSSAGLPENRKVHYAMVIDTRKCVGCHACTVACKAEFDVPLGVNRSWVESTEKGTYPNVRRSFLPRLCNQCSEPPCVSVCPTGATYKRKEDGIVVVDEDICIGCKYCILACPYDMRFINPRTGTAQKCDFCLHRVEQGLVPSCVNTCQGRARIFGDILDPESEVSKLVSTEAVSVLRQEMGTEPNVYYIDADHTREHEGDRTGQYVRVDAFLPHKERR